jgi:hypothetical protein
MYDNFSPYFDQEEPEIEITGMIASLDQSASYELDAIAVFKAKSRRYLVVHVSGCSCWPDRGSTYQQVCENKTKVQEAIRQFSEYTDFAGIMDALQAASWKVTSQRYG